MVIIGFDVIMVIIGFDVILVIIIFITIVSTITNSFLGSEGRDCCG